jgi:hypothetical protein
VSQVNEERVVRVARELIEFHRRRAPMYVETELTMLNELAEALGEDPPYLLLTRVEPQTVTAGAGSFPATPDERAGVTPPPTGAES